MKSRDHRRAAARCTDKEHRDNVDVTDDVIVSLMDATRVRKQLYYIMCYGELHNVLNVLQ